jgi:hypothetical protein
MVGVTWKWREAVEQESLAKANLVRAEDAERQTAKEAKHAKDAELQARAEAERAKTEADVARRVCEKDPDTVGICNALVDILHSRGKYAEAEALVLNWQQDPYGNYLARLVFPETTKELRLEVDLVAQITTINPRRGRASLSEGADNLQGNFARWTDARHRFEDDRNCSLYPPEHAAIVFAAGQGSVRFVLFSRSPLGMSGRLIKASTWKRSPCTAMHWHFAERCWVITIPA